MRFGNHFHLKVVTGETQICWLCVALLCCASWDGLNSCFAIPGDCDFCNWWNCLKVFLCD